MCCARLNFAIPRAISLCVSCRLIQLCLTDAEDYRDRGRSSRVPQRACCGAGPMVRIHLPPAGSLQTFGPSRVAAIKRLSAIVSILAVDDDSDVAYFCRQPRCGKGRMRCTLLTRSDAARRLADPGIRDRRTALEPKKRCAPRSAFKPPRNVARCEKGAAYYPPPLLPSSRSRANTELPPSHRILRSDLSHREAALRGAPASHGETPFRGAAGFREARRHEVHPARARWRSTRGQPRHRFCWQKWASPISLRPARR